MPKAKPGLLDEFEQFEKEHPPGRGPQCRTCRMAPDLRSMAEGLLKAGKASSTVALFLKSKGVNVSSFALRHHVKNHVG